MGKNSKTRAGSIRELRVLRRRMAEMEASDRELKVDEELFKRLIHTIPDILYMLDQYGRFVFVNESIRQLGYDPRSLIGRYFGDVIHPDDLKVLSRKKVLPKYRGKITGIAHSPKLFDERRTGKRSTRNLKARILLRGKRSTLENYCEAEIHSSGEWSKNIKGRGRKLLGSIGIIRDITERKRAEEAEQFERLSNMLIEFQEEERKKVARELHDGIGQVLTAIKLSLGMIKKDHPELRVSLHRELEESIRLIDTAMDDVRVISNRLRPAMLDNFGLIPCIEHEINFLASRSGMAIKFTWEEPECRLTPQKEIALYRVTQEALTNIIRHADVAKAEVSFHQRAGTLFLKIQDRGRGFDISRVKRPRGLGLLGMKERISSVGGVLKISSRPGQGTVLVAEVPC